MFYLLINNKEGKNLACLKNKKLMTSIILHELVWFYASPYLICVMLTNPNFKKGGERKTEVVLQTLGERKLIKEIIRV